MKYEVQYKRIEKGYVIVVADSENEAKIKFLKSAPFRYPTVILSAETTIIG